MTRRSARGRSTFLLLACLVAACSGSGTATPPASSGPTSGSTVSGGGATGAPVTAGGDLCALLGPGDFAAAGVTGAGTPTKNSDDPSNAYCVYAGRSAGTGGIELDVFVAADVAESEGTFDTVVETMNDDSATTRTDLGDVDAAEYDGATEGTFAAIAVWKGKLVYTIGIPMSDASRDQLLTLAKLVLERGAGIT